MSGIVGRHGPEWRFPVEWSKVWEFARAVHDDHADRDPPPVPPTFPAYGMTAFETFFGTLAGGFDLAHVLHADEDYEYVRPLRIGDVLLCRTEIVDEFYKEGRRKGTLRFVVSDTLMRDAGSGELVVRARKTMLQTHATRPPADVRTGPGAFLGGPAGAEGDAAEAARRRLGPAPAFRFGPVTLIDVIQYGGATYNFVPLHYDTEHARSAGHPDVFAHGLFNAGLCASFVTRWAGPDRVRRFAVRMREQVFLGEVLNAEGRVTGALTLPDGTPAADLAIELRRETRGGVAVAGRAIVALS